MQLHIQESVGLQALDPEFMKDYANREDQIGGTIREMQEIGPTSFELVIVGIRDDATAKVT